ncbi:RT0821/Lpp0805 family surface protein [Roseateles violae]|uniref:RT0821/Lpp0805 family surface protein n=1 Tax=Roseateles violae TaxID=3058042 RepID=A0ABT8DYA1_9BURK|nr:RT0821/Lpp0805 family surface protein [Pelomonas sp. PFR6]MDN3922319.1 RT0821/Lpp0805 family surface protein [Pelomonas sp. PFR6]
MKPMHKKARQAARSLFAAALLAALALPAQAVGWVKILQGTPAEQFDDEDMKLFFEHAQQAMNAEGEPQAHKWNNPATGSGGSFEVVARLKDKKSGAPCKKVRLSTYAKARAEKSSIVTACQAEDKRWRVVAVGNK